LKTALSTLWKKWDSRSPSPANVSAR